jgi:hypothetical protein
MACTSSSAWRAAPSPRERVVGLGLRRLLDVAEQLAECRPLVADDLAEEEVHPLDRRGALVQGVDLGVADVLLDRVVLVKPEPPSTCSEVASSS